MTKPIAELEPGLAFRLPYSGKSGVVVGHGNSGSRVKYDGSDRKVKLESSRTGQSVEFDAPGRVVIISSGTEVEPLGSSL